MIESSRSNCSFTLLQGGSLREGADTAPKAEWFTAF